MSDDGRVPPPRPPPMDYRSTARWWDAELARPEHRAWATAGVEEGEDALAPRRAQEGAPLDPDEFLEWWGALAAVRPHEAGSLLTGRLLPRAISGAPTLPAPLPATSDIEELARRLDEAAESAGWRRGAFRRGGRGLDAELAAPVMTWLEQHYPSLAAEVPEEERVELVSGMIAMRSGLGTAPGWW